MPFSTIDRAEGGIKLPLYSFQVPAGFASPAVDYIEKHVSLDELAEVRAPHVYLAKILGDSMIGAGIFDKDLIAVALPSMERSLWQRLMIRNRFASGSS